MSSASEFETMKGLASPSRRALAAAGIGSVEDLTKVRKADLAKMHGMGPKAIGVLEQVLAERELSFKAE